MAKGPGGPTAVLMDSDFEFGMVRMVEDVCLVKPFRSESEAEHWLAEVSRQQS